MKNKVIINARRDIGWKRRLFSDIVTACMWGAWIFVWLPVYRKLREAIGLHLDFGLAAKEVLNVITPISLPHSLFALVGTCILLLCWTLLPRRSATHEHAVESLEDYSLTFGISAEEIAAGRDSRISVVFHDNHGEITRIEPKR